MPRPQQFIPILKQNWVIALRALASTTDTADGQSVPSFLMPDLGGSHTLRGYPAWRFRDRSRLLLSGEYRWAAGRSPTWRCLSMRARSQRAQPTSTCGSQEILRAWYHGAHNDRDAHATRDCRTREGTSLSFAFSPSF
jgi:hypothetical protein